MINNKGLTLVELLAVLVVLTVVVAIVSPVVTRDLKKSRIEVCEHELDSFVAASKNWLTDKIDNNYDTLYNPDGSFKGIKVTVAELYEQGYITEYDENTYKNVTISITKPAASYVYKLENADVCK